MANRPGGFGMSRDLERKKAAKFDAEAANTALQWIREVLETGSADDKALIEKIINIEQEKDVITVLKDGVILCHLINIIKPGSVRKINTTTMAFKQMENIGNFLKACHSLECKSSDLFQTVDLYEGNNIPQVLNGIFSLGRKVQCFYSGPKLGVTEASENKREFTEEQLRAGEGYIGLQAGSNKGASQAGQNFGKSRSIID